MPLFRLARRLTFALILAGAVMALSPVQPAWAHALPTMYFPAQNAVLSAPPQHVQITFSEHVNPDISHIVVVNPSNQEVDNRDTQLSGDALTMTVTLRLLPPGSYVVAWRTHSADDGHIAGGSYNFFIARADGTVPPLTGPLPSGNDVGGAGNAPTNGLDFPTIVAALARWAGLLTLTLLLGIVFWWTAIVPRQPGVAPSATTDIAKRLAQSADLTLETMLAAGVTEIILQVIALEGSIRGITDLPLLQQLLLQSRFGQFVLLRMVLAVGGLVALWNPGWRTSLSLRAQRGVTLLFALALALSFLYSGHGGSALVWWGPLVDLLHLLSAGVWLGGIFTLTLIVLPALEAQARDVHAAYLAKALPVFSLPAVVGATALAITGPLNADVRMTAFSQLWTTAYGQVLSLKIILFLVMGGISYIHAFRLRPRITAQLATSLPSTTATPRLGILSWLEGRLAAFEQWQLPTTPIVQGASGALAIDAAAPSTDPIQAIGRLIRLEAALGAGVLLCAALLGPLSVTLSPSLISSNSFGATGGTQTFTQAADQLSVKLTIAPGRFGSNQVTVVVKNPDGSFASNGTVLITSSMVEMDMGTNSFTLSPASQPGTYTGSVDLAMAGHWRLTLIIRTREDPNNLHRTTVTVSASF